VNRRQFLAVGAAGLGVLAGCSSQADSSADTPTTADAPTTVTATPATGRPLTLLRAEQVVEGGLPLNRTRLVFALPEAATVDAAGLAAGLDIQARA
jgi:ABC-type Fe3+-hydroxamate transport system substrate-binding protein